MNTKLAKIVSETGAELFAKSALHDKGNLDDAAYVLKYRRRPIGKVYIRVHIPYIDPTWIVGNY